MEDYIDSRIEKIRQYVLGTHSKQHSQAGTPLLVLLVGSLCIHDICFCVEVRKKNDE